MGLGFNSYQIGILFSSMVFFYMLSLIIAKRFPANTLENLTVKKYVVGLLIGSLLIIALFKHIIMFILGNLGIIFAASILMPLYLFRMSQMAHDSNHGATMGIHQVLSGFQRH